MIKKVKKILCWSLIGSLLGCTSIPEPKKPKLIQKGDYSYLKEYMRWFIEQEMKEKKIVGLSVALVDDKEIVWQEGFGYANKANNQKATPQTHYRAGSITKLFNAMAVMRLVEEGKMDIDKPFKTYLPEFSIKSRFDSDEEITPRNMMTHHSGIPSDYLDGMFANNPHDYKNYLELSKNLYVSYSPNRVMSYSNLAITLLGYGVEEVSGEPYVNYINKNFFDPLEMKDSDLKSVLTGERASKSYHNGEMVKEYALGMIPAGALNTTVIDLAKLAMMINSNGMLNNKEVLKPQSLKEMFRVQNSQVALDLGTKMGLGYFINTGILNNEESVYGHGGATIAHNSMFLVAPTSKLGVVVMANSTSANTDKIARELLKKAWEAKNAKRLIDNNITTVLDNSLDFTGTYASVLGKLEIKKKSQNQYEVENINGTFSLKKDEKGYFGLKYKLLGFIPISVDELSEIKLYRKNVEGYELIVGEIEKETFLAAVRVETTPITKGWKARLGKYQILNQLEPDIFKIKEIEMKLEDGYLTALVTMVSGDKIVEILRVINENEVVIEGLGRGKGETIEVQSDGTLLYQGLHLQKINM
ncbi:MAG TPA: class A beta-lactamase-related serine hydrolase [Campylobacterales bacterium]|nr:class A beta-lactamase-related serine hydrolase [Campylobacterales bacterium]